MDNQVTLEEEQIRIFLKHLTKGDFSMESNEKTTIVIPEKTTGEKAIDWLRSVRVALHARILILENYKNDTAASKRYVSLAITALERSRMFMGKLIGAYGNKSPYPDGYKPENTVIEDMSDTYTGAELPTIISGQEIVFIKQQRKEAKAVIEGLESFIGHFPFNSNGSLFLIEVIISLHDVTNWLGMELWSLEERGSEDGDNESAQDALLKKEKEPTIDEILKG